MKKIMYVALLGMALVISSGNVGAQKMGNMSGQQMMMGKEEGQSHHAGQQKQQQMQSGMMGQGGSGMMMGSGMMPGMMMRMMGPRKMDKMMGKTMMSGMMMGSPMMCLAAGMDAEKVAQYEKFMKETRDIRKKLYDLRFQYTEALWNPETTVGQLRGMLQEMSPLQKQIQEKLPGKDDNQGKKMRGDKE